MKTLITSKLMRKCLILAVMIMALVYVGSSDRHHQTVMAAICCEDCPGGGDPTLAGIGCYYSDLSYECRGHCQLNDAQCAACQSACVQNAEICYSHCVYCYSNSGPGGSCNGTEDCPVNYFCDADNTCHPY